MSAVILSFFLLITSFSEVEEHEFHLSRTTVNYNSEEMAIQISTSIFIDDLELALKENGHDSLKICTLREKEDAELFIQEYLDEHLVVEIDGLALDFTFLGKEPSDDLMAVWCYLEAYDVPSFSEITISNTILNTQFDDQKNITVIQIDKDNIAQILFNLDKTSESVKP